MERKRNGREEPDEVRIFLGFSPGGEAAARRRLMRGELAWPNDEREGPREVCPHPALRRHLPPEGGKALEKEANHAYKK